MRPTRRRRLETPRPPQRAGSLHAARRRAIEDLATQIRQQFPGMPGDSVVECAKTSVEIGAGRYGNRTRIDDPVRAAVVAYVRHNLTGYDSLLVTGEDRQTARDTVSRRIHEILTAWETP